MAIRLHEDKHVVSVPQIVIDTNVLVAGTRSSRGASFQLFDFRGAEKFGIRIVTPDEVLKLLGASR